MELLLRPRAKTVRIVGINVRKEKKRWACSAFKQVNGDLGGQVDMLMVILVVKLTCESKYAAFKNVLIKKKMS